MQQPTAEEGAIIKENGGETGHTDPPQIKYKFNLMIQLF